MIQLMMVVIMMKKCGDCNTWVNGSADDGGDNDHSED